MSKKMWNKIFKTKTKINNKTLVVNENKQKRCSILYQEYQQNQNKTDNNEHLLQVQFNFNKHSPLKKQKEPNDATVNSTHSNSEISNSTATQQTEIENLQQLSTKENTKNKHKNRPQFSRFAKVVNSFSLKRSKTLQTTNKIEYEERAIEPTGISQKRAVDTSKTTISNGQLKDNSSKIESTKENIAQKSADLEPSANVALVPCPICNRTFNPVTLSKHVGICQKTASKRRKVFDSSRQRREGTDLAAYPVPKNYGLPPQPNLFPKPERSSSPQQNELATPAVARKRTVSQTTPTVNEDLVRSTARASLRNKPNNPTKLSTSTSGNESNFQRDRMRSSERINAKRAQVPQSEQCPHCERCFGIKAYDRHVEWCKEKALQAAIKQPNAKQEQNPAMERLQARTKYRAPCLKTKRSINRDKYSGMNNEENESFEGNKTSGTIKHDLMTQSMTSSITSERLQIEDVTYNYNDKQISNEESQGNLRSDDESVKSVKIKKYMPKPKNAYTMSMVKLPQLQMEEAKEPVRNISKNKLATNQNKKKDKPAAPAWVNPDGSLDPIGPISGPQPRRNCRNRVNKQIKSEEVTLCEASKDWQQMFLELEKEAKPLLNALKENIKTTAVRTTRSANCSPLRNVRALHNPDIVASELNCTPINVAAISRPKRKSARIMAQKKVNAPMKALPLNHEIYEQMLQLNTTEMDVISTQITMELDTGIEAKKSPTISYSRIPSPTQFRRSRSFTLSSPQQKAIDGKREIFISIEAEQNDYGQSPLSPASLRNIVGNAQTVVEVHEVGASNEAKFSKISDDDDGDADESANIDSEDHSLPNVQLNNAKNLIQRMQNHFQEFANESDRKQQQQQQVVPQALPRQLTPVHFEDEDSDDLSNGNMPNLTHNSRRSINTKVSADSAYGSLSRQRSTEFGTPQTRIGHQSRPATANLPMPAMKILQQQQMQQQQQFYKTKQNKARSNQYVYKGSSSGSGSDTSLPIKDFQKNNNQMSVTNYDLQQQQMPLQQQQQDTVYSRIKKLFKEF